MIQVLNEEAFAQRTPWIRSGRYGTDGGRCWTGDGRDVTSQFRDAHYRTVARSARRCVRGGSPTGNPRHYCNDYPEGAVPALLNSFLSGQAAAAPTHGPTNRPAGGAFQSPSYRGRRLQPLTFSLIITEFRASNKIKSSQIGSLPKKAVNLRTFSHQRSPQKFR